MPRVILVSNRLPITVRSEGDEYVLTPSAGGLASGLRSVHEQSDTIWIGWPGCAWPQNSADEELLRARLREVRTIPVPLAESEIEGYYESFSNGVLCPIYLYLTDLIQRDAWNHWNTYVEINRRFADIIADEYQPGDLIWVHDYHLSLVPDLVRRRIPGASIGFFLHIPFPSSEVFRILPWRTEILHGMLGADLIGFHTYSYQRHFERTVHLLLDIICDGDQVDLPDREVHLGVFPMGVDFHQFDRLSRSSEVLERVETIRREGGGRKLLLGVDRLDHTKGIPRRLLAIDHLLELEESVRQEVRLIQVVVPSRTSMESYSSFRRELDEMVGRINGRHATVQSVPIHYMFRSLELEELVALYRAADVMLVTPLRDGMNLVAKEYVASRSDEDGILVLSEFAGASSELGEALLVNPYNIDSVAVTICQALAMSWRERRSRMQALRDRVKTCDAERWASQFLEGLKGARQDSTRPEVSRFSTPTELSAMVDQCAAADTLLVLLDYDGTLVPFASSPDIAAPSAPVLDLLTLLATTAGSMVHIVSGRTMPSLDRWLGGIPAGLHAEHGAFARLPGCRQWTQVASASEEWKRDVRSMMQHTTLNTPGSLVEEKVAGIAWHYRMVDPDLGEMQAKTLVTHLRQRLADLPVRIFWSNRTVDVGSAEANKGCVAERLLAQAPGACVLAVGDDRTDEDMFASLPATALSVHVGAGPTMAAFRVRGVADVLELLGRVAASRAARLPALPTTGQVQTSAESTEDVRTADIDLDCLVNA